jgi:hypothetical protein
MAKIMFHSTQLSENVPELRDVRSLKDSGPESWVLDAANSEIAGLVKMSVESPTV